MTGSKLDYRLKSNLMLRWDSPFKQTRFTQAELRNANIVKGLMPGSICAEARWFCPQTSVFNFRLEWANNAEDRRSYANKPNNKQPENCFSSVICRLAFGSATAARSSPEQLATTAAAAIDKSGRVRRRQSWDRVSCVGRGCLVGRRPQVGHCSSLPAVEPTDPARRRFAGAIDSAAAGRWCSPPSVGRLLRSAGRGLPPDHRPRRARPPDPAGSPAPAHSRWPTRRISPGSLTAYWWASRVMNSVPLMTVDRNMMVSLLPNWIEFGVSVTWDLINCLRPHRPSFDECLIKYQLHSPTTSYKTGAKRM